LYQVVELSLMRYGRYFPLLSCINYIPFLQEHKLITKITRLIKLLNRSIGKMKTTRAAMKKGDK
jgi:hypothetical protein